MPAGATGDSNFRFVDVETGELTPSFAKGFHLGSAFVDGATVYVTGTDAWGGHKVEMFWSGKIANPKLTIQQREIVKNAQNLNNSDIDFCEYKGRTIITYSWGNQRGTEFLAEAFYEGTVESFLRGFFPDS